MIVVVPIVSVVVLAIAVGAILWAYAATSRARWDAPASRAGTAGPPPLTQLPGGQQQGMWQPRSPELRGWTWSGGHAQPPDVLSGRHAAYDTIVVRELRGAFRGRDAFSHIRRAQRLPVMARSAPQTHWGMVAGLRSRVALPRFFALTGQPAIVASTFVLDAAEGLQKSTHALGQGTILWCDPQWTTALIGVLRPALERGTPEPFLLASEGPTLLVCGSRGEDEQAVLQRLHCGDWVLNAFEGRPPHGQHTSRWQGETR